MALVDFHLKSLKKLKVLAVLISMTKDKSCLLSLEMTAKNCLKVFALVNFQLK